MSTTPDENLRFEDLNLPDFLLKALNAVGYESPSPIQAATIPVLIAGNDIVGMAQTGTGKTAAFALPLLNKIDLKLTQPQALVLCPTRELALQVAEALQSYAAFMKGFHVLPIYGGQDMRTQLRAISRGVHVIVATPGRLIDHLDRRSISFDKLHTLVLDEADEMLRMGFAEDVETILQKTPADRQIALFSATMPPQIRRVASKYLNNPTEVSIASAVSTNDNIEQSYWLVSGTNKLDALTRILEVEEFDGMIIFVRTKTATVDLAEKLSARGFSASPLNGDMNQTLRQRTVDQLKRGQLDILIATDVAARGLDVDRISHVINFDIPYDEEAYVHRIGRTGRAGRKGKAILFVAPRERRLLYSIEKTTRQKITQVQLPSRDDLIDRRSQAFKTSIIEGLNNDDKGFFEKIVSEICHDQEVSPENVAAAMAYLLQKDRPLQPPKDRPVREPRPERDSRDSREPRQDRDRNRNSRDGRQKEEFRDRPSRPAPSNLGSAEPLKDNPEIEMERFCIRVGRNDEVSPREIVGAIANEADIEGRYIGHIKIYDDFSTVDLPGGMPNDVMAVLRKTRVKQRQLNIERINDDGTPPKMPERSGEDRKPSSKPRANAGKGKRDYGDKGNKPFKKSGSKPDFTGKSDDSKKPHKRPKP
ncbi:DEAD/DEAH box helicase [Teredinibacter waterburyi]|jgi:ATP-dependent RNA helicase CsdA (EC 5.99.1.-)|uniref:DEAD/DEAH box helicase n=1 Tax=Teredinibacter waterburyi TaxID=1500538 RepID=UPI00165FF45D|nr:DEAD/DEAH box helicase [Teredinibacter waterburyi]